jgi:hypothetical protein
LAAVADSAACDGDAVGYAPPDDEPVAVPQPAVTAARRHAATTLDRISIRAS